MVKAKIKVEFEVVEKEDNRLRKAIMKNSLIKESKYTTVPRIGEWIGLLELSHHYNLSEEELKWLSAKKHKYRIENVHKCDGYIEAELDVDKIWCEEALQAGMIIEAIMNMTV